MDIEHRYFTIHRLILSLFGMWPYQQWHNRIMSIASASVLFGLGLLTLVGDLCLVLLMISLTLKVTRSECSIDSVSLCLQMALPITMVFLKLCYFCFYSEQVKMLLEHIKYDWKLLQSVDVVMAKQYAETGRFYTFIFTILCIPVPIIITVILCASNRNAEARETSEQSMPLPVEIPYFDHQKNFLYIMLFLFILILGTELIIIEVGTLYLTCIQHACGFFCIVGRRLEVMFDDWEEGPVVYHRQDAVLKIIQSIVYHARVVEFTKKLNYFYGPLYCIDIGFAVVILCCDILQFFQAYVNKDIEAAFSNFGHICVVIGALLAVSYWGQILLDHSGKVFRKSYMSQWYLAPFNVQKLLLTIMTSSTRKTGFMLTQTKVLCFEIFTTVIQMSVSYFMALNSLQ